MKCKKCGNEFEGEVCPNCETEVANSSSNNNVKTKKPFYKNKWFIVLAIVVVLVLIILIGNGIKGRGEKINWSELELNEYLPTPDKSYGEVVTNRNDLLMVNIYKISEKEYKDYVQKCIDAGYTQDLEFENWDTVYGAFNEEGYSIRISFVEYTKEMSITLEIPETTKMKEIEWPTDGLGAMLPAPKSNLGYISYNNSDSFIVHVGNTSIDGYKEYVKTCKNSGFTLDYSESDKYFSAKNSEGYELDLRYLGANVIEISLESPETESSSTIPSTTTSSQPENTTTPPASTTQDNTTTSSNSSGLSTEFKDAMDSYETFMNDYIAFMEKYKNSNGTDMSLISDYTDYMNKYTQFTNDFAAWEDKEMNSEEAAYYLEVQTRVNQKLINAAV